MFDQFAITKDEKVKWPICYIKCILGLFKETETTRFILDECNKLVVQAVSTESGKDWECIVGIAVGFRCLSQAFYGFGSPFEIVPLGVVPNVFAVALPDDITVEGANNFILSKSLEALKRSRITNPFPLLVLATPTFSKFPIVDGFVAYYASAEIMTLYGYQTKLGKGLPKKGFTNSQGMEKGFLLQGKAPDDDHSYKGWEHWNKEQVQQLLGYSLKDLYPGDWTSFNSLNAAAAEEEEQTVPSKNKKIKINKRPSK